MINFNEFTEKLNEAKEGMFYVVELPSSDNDYEASVKSGPHSTADEAKQKGGYEAYGINQDATVAVYKDGDLHTVHHRTSEPVFSLGKILGPRAYRILKRSL